MSDSENYFSDSDKSNNEDQSDTNLSEDELGDTYMDDETRLMIYHAFQNRDPEKETQYQMDISSTPLKKKRERIRKPKVKKGINLFELNQKLEENKPKKWTSKRSQNKKEELGITNEVFKKRCFNPRLPPPNKDTFKKKKETNILSNDVNMFPTLGETYSESPKNKNINV